LSLDSTVPPMLRLFVPLVGLAPSSRELYAFYLRLLAERHGLPDDRPT